NITGRALESSATAFYAYEGAPQVHFLDGDIDISVEPLYEEEEEEEDEEEEALILGINDLLPTPMTANEVAVDLGHLSLQDLPITFEELESDYTAYEEFASGFINLDP
ncbi:hypothetical protein EC957_009864, partial [Mortierella hygrophila]